jgi:hypothetical protein
LLNIYPYNIIINGTKIVGAQKEKANIIIEKISFIKKAIKRDKRPMTTVNDLTYMSLFFSDMFFLKGNMRSSIIDTPATCKRESALDIIVATRPEIAIPSKTGGSVFLIRYGRAVLESISGNKMEAINPIIPMAKNNAKEK